MEVKIPCGEKTCSVHLPAEQVAWILQPADRPALPDVPAALRAALAQPTGSPPFAELARQAQGEVVILVDDGTRSTPQALLLPVLLDELNRAGVADKRIVLLIALGTHRPMDAAECEARFGREATRRVRVENLDAQNPAAFVDLGVSPSGVPIFVARRFYEAGLSVAVGNIVPHMYTGFSGGAKMVQPGVCSPLTTARTHLRAAPLVHQTLGQIENPVRAELDLIARRSRLGFIINTVLNGRNEVIEIVAGDLVAAHRKGAATAREVFGVRVPEQPRIVLAGSYPADRDWWQAVKAINSAAMAARPGGEVIIVTPCPEGIAPDHPFVEENGLLTQAQLLEMAQQGACSDEVAAAACIAWDVTRSKVRVTVVSDGISPEQAARMGMDHARTIEGALELAYSRQGRHARIGVMPTAGEMLPIV